MGDSLRYKDWFEKAAHDLCGAEILMEHDGGNDLVAFHCQQAMEKMLKGWLLKTTGELLDGHSLVFLCRKATAAGAPLKGNLREKQMILKRIADALEPRRAELKAANKTIENDFFYMVNAMNVRHNNCDPADQGKYNEKFAKLSAKEQEEWYDNIYQEGLMAFLSLEQVKREKKIADFKKK